MKPLRPRRTSHGGSVMASGLAIDTGIAGEQEARRRILRLPWSGLGVFRLGPVLVVRFSAPVRLDAATAGGAPLVRYGRLLSAAPLDADEQEALDAQAADEGTLILAEGGSIRAAPLSDETRLDISEWIDVSGFSLAADLCALGAVQPDPQAAVAAPAATVRQSFGMGPLHRDAAETLEALSRRQAQHGSRRRAGQGWL